MNLAKTWKAIRPDWDAVIPLLMPSPGYQIEHVTLGLHPHGDLDPIEAIVRLVIFLIGGVPISKSEFRKHWDSCCPKDTHEVIDDASNTYLREASYMSLATALVSGNGLEGAGSAIQCLTLLVSRDIPRSPRRGRNRDESGREFYLEPGQAPRPTASDAAGVHHP